MSWYTVEVTLTSVSDDDWTRHLNVIDAVPGTILIQDHEAPTLTFPVESDEPFKAARFAEGILSFFELTALSGEISDMPEVDFERDDDAHARVDYAHNVSNVPQVSAPILRRAGSGHRWLALSADEAPWRIAVIASSEADAEALYRERAARWLVPEAAGHSPSASGR